ncbi:MAG: ATP-binding protein [Akkermansiaceae bacterium]|nr:ATP-binding protein [Akkermansiaceae bacterium]MCP5551334.1 ATP-binding protein [Akkermansiaceae bacterium]
MPSTPSWSDEIRTQYLSGAANTFVLHGNVQDRLLLPANGDGQPARIGNLTDFLVQHQLRKFDLVLSYELGSGVRVELGAELFRKLRGAEEPPREPAQAVGYLDYLLRFLVNLRKIRPGETPPAESGVDAVAEKGEAAKLAGRNFHVAFLIRGAELIFPMTPNTLNYQLGSMASVVRSWSRDTHFLEQNLALFLVAEKVADLHPILSNNPRAAEIEVEMPGAADLEPAFAFFAGAYPKALSHFAKTPKLPAERLAGATLGSIESLLKIREHAGEPLREKDLAELKKDLVEKDSQGLIEFLEPDRTLEDVYGQEAIKTWVRQDIELWRQDDLDAMPMGYLLCGPVGTGKTYLVECLAGEAGVPVVKMKNFRDKWVGSTEGNLEKIFNLLHALGRCIVFIDEADQALGSRDAGSGDSGVSGRVYSMMAKEMSDTRNRGRILWILASSRPDLIEVDLKRPGRVDVKIPLFPTLDPKESYHLIRALGKKHRLDLPKEIPPTLKSELLPELLTPGAAEAIAIKVYRGVKTSGANVVDALRDSLEDYQNPIPRDIMDFQIGLAVREASDLDFVPERFRIEHLRPGPAR